MNLLEMADRLKALKNEKSELEQRTKEINAEIADVEKQMVDEMVMQEMQNFSRGGTLFYLNTRFHASPIPEKKSELYKVLKEQGFGDLIQETINTRTLDSFVKEQFELNGDMLPDWLQGFVNTYEESCIGMRKSK